MAKKRVFVSHPYADNPIGNKIKANRICKYLLKQGYLPISPLHLFSYMENDNEIRDDIMQFCYELIDKCDIIHIYGDSDGCRKEHDYAYQMGKEIQVMYKHI